MRLTVHTDYALRLLILLAAKRGEAVTIQEAAERYAISKNHLMKVAHQLGLAGWITTTRGRGGGLQLALEPERISIGAVIRRTEPDLILVECFDRASSHCRIQPACVLSGALREALEAFLSVLDGYTLADLAKPRQELAALLALTA